MSGWDGKTERRTENLELTLAVKSLEIRFDNELGSGKLGEEGSVKRHIRDMSDKINKMSEVLLGNGADKKGISERMNELVAESHSFEKELAEHKNLDRWLFGSVITLQLFILGKMIIHV